MPYYMLYNYSYILVLLPAILLTLIAQAVVRGRYKKYSRIATKRGLTGAQAAENILKINGARGVRVERAAGGTLSDHFDPRSSVIRLSGEVHDSTSVAAVCIAAHEAGHALQYAEGYGPIKIREKIIPVTRFASTLALPLLLIGLAIFYEPLIIIGIAFYMAAIFFQIITLPVEFNASKRAMQTLEDMRYLREDELKAAGKVLNAAALTYVAALAVSLAQLFRFLLMFSGNGRTRGGRR